jgi:hypothetical protein
MHSALEMWHLKFLCFPVPSVHQSHKALCQPGSEYPTFSFWSGQSIVIVVMMIPYIWVTVTKCISHSVKQPCEMLCSLHRRNEETSIHINSETFTQPLTLCLVFILLTCPILPFIHSFTLIQQTEVIDWFITNQATCSLSLRINVAKINMLDLSGCGPTLGFLAN